MFFKNLTLYRLPAPWKITAEQLETQLARITFQRCPSHQPMSRGWISPREDGGLVYHTKRHWMICLATEQRLLPGHVITQTVRELADKLKAENGYAPGRKQLRELRERVIAELLPKAFTRICRTHVWIDPDAGWMGVDTSSPARTDDVIEQLRKSLDHFPLASVQTERSPVSAMTEWLAGGEAPEGFTIDRDAEVKSVSEEKATVRYVRCPLEGDDIKARVVAGMLPSRLALTWNERISFVLTERLQIKRLGFLDLMKEQAEAANQADQFDADFSIMASEFQRFVPALLEALGGEVA